MGAINFSANQRAEEGANPSKRVLIVDDNADAADLIAELLRLHGHETLTAHGGREGISLAMEFKPDVMLVDLGMPDVDGFAVAVALKKQPEMKKTGLIAFTAWDDLNTRARTLATGFDGHLGKPADIHYLLQFIAQSKLRTDLVVSNE